MAELASRLRFAIARTARRLRQESAGELSPTLIAALATIAREEPLSPSELAEAERIRRPTATQVVDRLERRGLVERATDPDDGRRCALTTTPTGRELIARTRAAKDAYLARRLGDLDAAEREVLARASEILERILEQGAEVEQPERKA